VALSERFELTCLTGKHKYTQVFTRNMAHRTAPEIAAFKSLPGTTVAYWPDFSRFQDIASMEPLMGVLQLSVARLAAFYPKVEFWYNGVRCEAASPKKFMGLFAGTHIVCRGAGTEGAAPEEIRYGFCLTPAAGWAHDACVNGGYTPQGGSHVDAVVRARLARGLTARRRPRSSTAC